MADCEHCNSELPIGYYVRARWDKPTRVSCRRCGASHAVLRGQVEVISPAMLPVDVEGRRSPWMLPWTRPVAVGLYECQFLNIGFSLHLWWNGAAFQVSREDARLVVMTTFRTWRGTWANS